MAANRKTIDTDLIYLREVYARTSFNRTIPANQTLIANGDDSTRWDYIRVSTFNTVTGDDGVPLYANDNLSTLNISTSGPPGLLSSYVDTSAQALILRAAPPVLAISQRPVPDVTSTIALAPPDVVNISNYSTVTLLGVRDVLFSTVTDISGAPPAIFVSISSFTSAGYSSISGEAYSWRPYLYNVLTTAQGLPTFTSSIQTTWATGLQNISTAEAYPDYITGDAYFSTVSINMSNYIGYIQPGVTKVVLEVQPTYILPRFLLGTEEYPTLFKNISSYIQYTNPTSTIIISGSQNTDMIVSQQSNAYTSNYFNKPMKLPIDSGIIASNWALDGPVGYYTLYHRIPGGMAQLVSGDSCGYYIGARGGMSNDTPMYLNATPPQNGVFMSIYNRMPFPLTPEELEEQILNSPSPGGFSIGTVTMTQFTFTWQGAVGAFTYEFIVNGVTILPTPPLMLSLSRFSMDSLLRFTMNPIAVTVTGKTATFTGLTAGTTYAVTVVAIAVGGGRTPSSTVYMVTSPAPPDNLSVMNVTATGFIVNWFNAVGATYYTYTLNGVAATPYSQANHSATFTNLTANTSYLIGVTAWNTGGSTTSTEGLSVITAPGPAVNFTSVIGVTNVTIGWRGAAGATSYSYSVNGTPTTPASYVDLSATFTGLIGNTLYNFVVTAIGNGGSTDSAPYSITTGGPPVDLSANTITNTSFNLTWRGSFDTATYTYTLNGQAPSFYGITVNTLGKRATFLGVAASTPYSVVVIANYEELAISSDPYSLTTNPNPPTVPVVTANSITAFGFTLAWTGGVGASSYTYSINGTFITPTSTGVNTATFTGLLPSTTYPSVVVTATNITGSASSLPISVRTLTPPPLNPTIVATSVTSTQIVVAWQSGTYASSYTYTLNGAAAIPSSPTDTSATFAGLTPNTLYEIIVTANNASGTAASNNLSVTTPRSAPAALTITSSAITSTSFVISWALDTNVISYSYTFNGVTVTPSQSSTTSATFTGLTINTLYNVIVTASNNGGNRASNTLPVTTLRSVPAAPTITSSGITSTGFVISWPLDTNVTSYSYTLDGVTATPSSSTSTSATFTDKIPNTPYEVIVTAINNGGNTASNTLSVTTLRSAPTAPVISTSAITSTGFTITWALDTNVTSYTYTLDDATATPSSSTTTSAIFTGLLPNTSHTIRITATNNNGSANSNTLSVTTNRPAPAAPVITSSAITSTGFVISWALDTNVASYSYTLNGGAVTPSSSTTTSATFTSLNSNTLYNVIVTATNNGGNTASNSLPVTTLRAPPSPPVISTSTITSVGFTITWPLDTNITSYSYTLDGATGTPSASSTTSATFIGLLPNTSYTIFITASNNNGPGANSNTLSITTNRPAPGAPVISSSAITSTGFLISWTPVANATSYVYTLNGGSEVPTTSSSSTTVTGQTPNTAYSVIVTARNNGGDTPSNTLSVRTIIDPPTGLSSSNITENTFTLNWTGSTGATTYTFLVGGNVATPTYTAGATTASFINLNPSTDYSVQVVATDGTRNSLPSTALPVRTSDPPPPITFSSSGTNLPGSYTVPTGYTRMYVEILSGSGGGGGCGNQCNPSGGGGGGALLFGTTVVTAGTAVGISSHVINGGAGGAGSLDGLRTNPPAPGVTGDSVTLTLGTYTIPISAGRGGNVGGPYGGGDWNPVPPNVSNGSSGGFIQIPPTLPPGLNTAGGNSGQNSNIDGVGSSALAGNQAYTGGYAGMQNSPVGDLRGNGNAGSAGYYLITFTTGQASPLITAPSISSTRVVISWPLDATATAYTYTLNGNTVTASAETPTTADFAGLTPNTPYTVVVTAERPGGALSSNALSIRTALDPPTALVSSNITQTEFTLNWTGSIGATNYTFLLGGNVATPTYTPGSTTATFTGLTPSIYYVVQVVATDGTRNATSIILPVKMASPPPVTYSSSGTVLPGSYSIPPGYTSMYVELLSGSGGGAGAGPLANGGFGGGGGAYVYGTTVVTAGASLSISTNVINGGTGGVKNSTNSLATHPDPGGNGDSLTLTLGSTSIVIDGGYGGNVGVSYGSGWQPPVPAVVVNGSQRGLVNGAQNAIVSLGLNASYGGNGVDSTVGGVPGVGPRALAGKGGYSAGGGGMRDSSVGDNRGDGESGSGGYYLITLS